MNTNFIFAQMFGFVAFFISVISVLQKSRNSYIYFNFSQNVFSGMQYFFLGKMVAFYLCLITLLRLIVYSYKSKFNKIFYLVTLFIFLIISIFVSYITFDTFVDIFPAIASVLVCISVWQSDIFVIKFFVIITKFLWGIYACFTGAYMAIIMDVFMIAWTISYLLRRKELFRNAL